jgi:hypothetical protein
VHEFTYISTHSHTLSFLFTSGLDSEPGDELLTEEQQDELNELRQQEIPSLVINAIANSPSISIIELLKLSDFKGSLDPETADVLCTLVLPQAKQLSQLELFEFEFPSAETATNVFRALGLHPNIQALVLEACVLYLDEQAMQALKEMVKSLIDLRLLNLSHAGNGSEVSDDEWAAFAGLLRHALTSLHVQGTSFGNNAANALVKRPNHLLLNVLDCESLSADKAKELSKMPNFIVRHDGNSDDFIELGDVTPPGKVHWFHAALAALFGPPSLPATPNQQQSDNAATALVLDEDSGPDWHHKRVVFGDRVVVDGRLMVQNETRPCGNCDKAAARKPGEPPIKNCINHRNHFHSYLAALIASTGNNI